jgi:pimeloyl-ACP methyl ester carboxylesterase
MKLEIISKLHNDSSTHESVILIHGACMGAWVWEDNFLPYFYEKGFNVYAFSFRNHGNSDAEDALRWLSINAYVQDLTNVINQIKGPIHLIGHSMGGFTIQHYLQNKAPNIKSAILLCSVPSHGLWRLIGKLILHYPLFFIKSVFTFSWLPVLNNYTRLQRIMFRVDMHESKMKYYSSKLQEESFLVFLQMVILKLPKIVSTNIPLMIIGGEKDYLIPLKDTIRMAKNYKLEPLIVKNASHCLMLEEGWDEVAEKIYSFIK